MSNLKECIICTFMYIPNICIIVNSEYEKIISKFCFIMHHFPLYLFFLDLLTYFSQIGILNAFRKR